MARNYSNTVSGTISLAAGMTAVQTTATVSDASTLPAVDFTVLVDDEVMLVTGVAGNVLTVRRGFDGTTPAVHSSGAAVRHVVVAADVGKSLVRGPVVAGEPTTASDPMDDLFDDGAIDPKWTQRNTGTAATWTEGADGLTYSAAAEANIRWKSIMQSAPAGDFRVEAAYWLGDYMRVNWHVPTGMIVSRSAGTASNIWVMGYRAVVPEFFTNGMADYTTWPGGDITVGAPAGVFGVWGFERVGTEWRFEWSHTGRLWQRLRTVTEPWTVVEVGLALNVENGTYGMSSGFRWFRRVR